MAEAKKPGRKPKAQAAVTAEEKAPEITEINAKSAPAQETPAAPASPATFTEDQVQKMIAEAVAKATAEAAKALKAQMAQPAAPQIVQIAADVEKVHFLWMAEVADDNQLLIGGENSGYAPIVGRTGEFMIPKSDLSRVLNSAMREWMRRRWLIVLDGMTDEEREIYGVNYRDGELLDRMAFTRMVELEDKMLDIYPKLCPGHREMVAKRYYEAYMSGNQHVRRDVVTKLNDMSIELGSEDGDFDAVLEAMNEADRRKKK